jgi:oligopeptidase A
LLFITNLTNVFIFYSYDEEILCKYFPLTRVIINTFRLVRELFNVEIVERQKIQGWNRNVHFFDVFDPEVSMSEPVGSFYLDPFTTNEDDVIRKNINSVILLMNRSKICNMKPLSSIILTLKQPENTEEDVFMSFDNVRLFIANVSMNLYNY